MCATYVTLVTSLLIEIIIQLCLLERSLQEMKDYEDLKSCIQWHLDILVFIKKFQKFCGIGVSAVFACGTLNICATLALVIQSNKISYAIYSSKWVDSDTAYKKLINIYILFTEEPLVIRLGGGTFSASLPVFITVFFREKNNNE
nr:unnamed protein product [Callosobruchus analis]